MRFEEVAPGAGADGVVDCLSQLALDPGDEIVCGWPSFPSYVIDALKLGAVARTGAAARPPLRPRRDARGDRAADEARLRLPPEQPDRDDEHAGRARRVLRPRPRPRADGARPGLLRVRRRSRLRGRRREYLKAGRRVVVLRTFSKIYGLAGLRVGYAVGPAEVVTAIGKVRRAFDVNSAAQEAALASLDAADELARRRRENAEGRVAARADPARARARAGRAGGRELPLRRGRRGRAAAVRAASARRRDRPPAGRLRRAGRDPRHGRHARGERVLRRGARPRAQRAARS